MKQSQRDYAKQIIRDSQIKRLSRAETLDMLKTKGISMSMTTLKRFRADLKNESSEWITNLAKDRDAYVGLYKEGIDELHLLRHECYKVLFDPFTKPFVKLLAVEQLRKLRSDITDLEDSAPIVMAIKDSIGSNEAGVPIAEDQQQQEYSGSQT